MKYFHNATQLAVAFALMLCLAGVAGIATAETGVQLDPGNVISGGTPFWIGALSINNGYLDVGQSGVVTPTGTGFKFKPVANDPVNGNGNPDTISPAGVAGVGESGFSALMDAVYQGNNFANGTYDGNVGVRSLSSGTTSLNYNSGTAHPNMGLGYLDNSAVGAGYTVFRNMDLTTLGLPAVSGGANDGYIKAYLVTPTLLGDANLDGFVDSSDLGAVLSYWHQSAKGWQYGDFNGDGFVDSSDLGYLLSNWHQSTDWSGTTGDFAMPALPPPSAGLAAAPSAVPEPGSLAILFTAILGFASWLRIKR